MLRSECCVRYAQLRRPQAQVCDKHTHTYTQTHTHARARLSHVTVCANVRFIQLCACVCALRIHECYGFALHPVLLHAGAEAALSAHDLSFTLGTCLCAVMVLVMCRCSGTTQIQS